MADDTQARVDAVATAMLAAEFHGDVTVEIMRAKYGDREADDLQRRYRQRAKEFLAAFDAANKFPVPRR